MQSMPQSQEATIEVLEQAQKALNKAKVRMMTTPDVTFFTVLCFLMEHRINTSVPTAATDGKQIIFNPHFFLSLTSEEQLFLVLHETMHVAFMHVRRTGDKDPGRYNRAADYVINWFLTKLNFKMPEGGLLNSDYRDMSTDEVYMLLEDDKEADKQCPMDIIAGDENNIEETKALDEILIKANTISAAQKHSGNLPKEIALYIENLLSPKLPWTRILSKYCNNLVKRSYSYRKLNKRFFPTHLLPTPSSNGLDNIAMACDTSGSVTQKNFDQVCGETAAIFKQLKPKTLTFLQFDTEIKKVSQIKSFKDFMQLNFTGRGGTQIDPVLKWAADAKPKLLIIFTDGYFRKPSLDLKIPVIWLIYDNPKFTASFGKVIHYNPTE